ncbi:unnamed protein product [Cylicocyclus nassatus]|uniref:Poly(A) RNA polymerase mitochondrial-like central palm domain-containing protein n=1 Tax=Cylicocyclus nassatus TaxID=53992 RepID=A0AA36GX36_CYLNA|nr:unnamed protein product [Cylicocyclus nassatus]
MDELKPLLVFAIDRCWHILHSAALHFHAVLDLSQVRRRSNWPCNGRCSATRKGSHVRNEMKSARSRPVSSQTVSTRRDKVTTTIRPHLPWMSGSYCLPIVGLRNDLNGSALQYIRLTSMFDAFSPYIYKNKTGVIEISRAMKLHKEDNSFTERQLELIVRFKVELEVHLSNYFGTRVMLAIYGSTLNGFGSCSCDVDMSLSFPAGPPKRKIRVGGGIIRMPAMNSTSARKYQLSVSVVRIWISKQT